jgi:hypothetical protein
MISIKIIWHVTKPEVLYDCPIVIYIMQNTSQDIMKKDNYVSTLLEYFFLSGWQSLE